jgi:hypothetical protein
MTFRQHRSPAEASPTDKTNANAPDARETELAKQETKLVKRSKCLVLFVLLAAATGCGAGKLLLRLDRNETQPLLASDLFGCSNQ